MVKNGEEVRFRILKQWQGCFKILNMVRKNYKDENWKIMIVNFKYMCGYILGYC